MKIFKFIFVWNLIWNRSRFTRRGTSTNYLTHWSTLLFHNISYHRSKSELISLLDIYSLNEIFNISRIQFKFIGLHDIYFIGEYKVSKLMDTVLTNWSSWHLLPHLKFDITVRTEVFRDIYHLTGDSSGYSLKWLIFSDTIASTRHLIFWRWHSLKLVSARYICWPSCERWTQLMQFELSVSMNYVYEAIYICSIHSFATHLVMVVHHMEQVILIKSNELISASFTWTLQLQWRCICN